MQASTGRCEHTLTPLMIGQYLAPHDIVLTRLVLPWPILTLLLFFIVEGQGRLNLRSHLLSTLDVPTYLVNR